jgi:hypothetical protein
MQSTDKVIMQRSICCYSDTKTKARMRYMRAFVDGFASKTSIRESPRFQALSLIRPRTCFSALGDHGKNRWG